jgi:tetratricopeptide (TPR) repeat protein
MNDALQTPSTALMLLQSGRYEEAETVARDALAQFAGAPDWLTVLALTLSAQQRPDEARPIYQQLTTVQPDVAAHWSNLGNCLCELGQEAQAHSPLLRALDLNDSDDATHFGLARVYSDIGPIESALGHIERAITLSPDDIEYRILRARIFAAMEQWGQAQEEIDLLQRAPLDAGQRAELGYLYLHGNSYDKAIAIFRQPPADPALAFDYGIGLVTALERINRTDEALTFRATLPTSPPSDMPRLREKFLQMDAKLAARSGDHARACALIREQIAAAPDHPTRFSSQWFDLGAALDKLGDIDTAMDAFARAHRSQCAVIDPRHPSLTSGTSIPALLRRPLPSAVDWPPAPSTDNRPDPVFVVGFPRSGTTLLEQLLDAHDQLVSFDEQPFLQRLFLADIAGNGDFFDAHARLDARSIQELRALYFQLVDRAIDSAGARRPVDKNPLNMARLPWLQRVFPNAQVVLAVRHPCDVVLSCHMQHFRSPVLATNFGTLEQTARLYNDIFTHWLRAQPNCHWPVRIVRNEDLIADTAKEARGLFDYLRLPWQDELLGFTDRARDKGAIKTPSYSQVIEKVNAKAVGRWQRYRAHFTPATIATLSPWVTHFGYPPIE